MRVVRQVDERTAAVWDDWKGQQPQPFDYGWDDCWERLCNRHRTQ